MNAPFDDTTRWSLLGSRFETPQFITDEIDRMFEEWIESLPIDDPTRLLWYTLPKPPRRDGGER